MTANETSTRSQNSIKAIADAIEAVFRPPSIRSPEKTKKRTVLKQTSGKIMTEKHVIEEMKEANSNKNKRPRSSNQISNATKKRKGGTTTGETEKF